MSWDFENEVAVVTGAASGIRRATALRLAGEGCALALVDIDESRVQETAQLLAASGSRASLKRLMPIGFHKLFAERIRVPGS